MGKVFLVGAGPGDPGLITVKGRDILQRADVVIYDYLANPRLLAQARADAEIIYAGKSGHHHHIDQGSINALLVDKASGSDIVCRLKGGDAFVFGRGGEEALALREAGIPFEVVPGVTSAYAVPAYAGIPVTHRGLASDVTFITGHEDPKKPGTDIDWACHGGSNGTLVFLMGVKNLAHICDSLIEHGRPADTPVALIRWGTHPRQETMIGTLTDIAARAADADFKPPAITVIGEVVSLREQISWFEDRPLFGRTVVVTRSRDQASALVDELEGLGAEVLEMPTIATKLLDDEGCATLDEAIRDIATRHRGDAFSPSVDELGEEGLDFERLRTAPAFDYIILTSANGVAAFFARLRSHDLDVRSLAGSRILAIGTGTAGKLASEGLTADLLPADFVAEGALQSLLDDGISSGDRVLIPRALVARELLPDRLRAMGVEVVDAPSYQTIAATDGADDVAKALAEGRVHYITFTSSSTVKNFETAIRSTTERTPEAANLTQLTAACSVVSIGPITSQTAVSLGMKVSIEASPSTIEGIVASIVTDSATRP